MKDPTKTIKYYDPIYQVITIKPYEKDSFGGRRFWHRVLGEPNDCLIENIITKVMKSAEMSRLNFLRQSGLAFLVYPSSTHNRFAHSLGTYHLGIEALNRAWVETPEPEKKIMSLNTYVESLKLKEEFLLGLLLHDVGHFPFSHVIENNHELPFEPKSHEEIATDYILGGKYSKAFQEYLKDEYGLEICQSLSSVLDNLNIELKGPIDKNAICYLICRESNYLDGIDEILKNKIKMLGELTSGLLDLDRFDHYRRDSFFMGTNLAHFNVCSFLDDVILTENGIKLKRDGVSHALSLLQSQDNIRTYNFEHPENLAYEAMLNYCISEYFSKLKNSDPSEFEKQQMEILFWTDEELLRQLLSLNIPEVKRIIYKIKFREPYSLLKKYHCENDRIRDIPRLLSLRKDILRENSGGIKPEQLLFRIPRKCGQKINPEGEWLSLDRLMDADGNYLSMKDKAMEKEVYHLLNSRKEHQNCVWVFCDGLDEEQKSKIEKNITRGNFN